MLVIDAAGEKLGVMSVRQALQVAEQAGLDLVEVAPNSRPPVCRLLDYGRFKYEQTKKEREAKKHQRSNVLREVRFRPRIKDHDVEAKANLVLRLLDEGSKVRVSVIFRGREGSHPEIGWRHLRHLAELVKDKAAIERPPAAEGDNLTMILAPAKHLKEDAKEGAAKEGPNRESAAKKVAKNKGE